MRSLPFSVQFLSFYAIFGKNLAKFEVLLESQGIVGDPIGGLCRNQILFNLIFFQKITINLGFAPPPTRNTGGNRIIQRSRKRNSNGGSEYLLHGNVRRSDVLPAHVLDLCVQVDVFSRNISGSVQPQCACQWTGSATTATRDVAILAQLYRFLKRSS